jgi:hypothetical protein
MALPFLKKDPSPILPILDALKGDASEYVRRSVANNLNDISKDHPELVVKLAQDWKGMSRETDKVLKHATRTLLKKGNTGALKIFGFGGAKNIAVDGLKVTPAKLKIGGHVHFTFTVKNTGRKAEEVRTEYVVHFVKANGTNSPKVFQVAEKQIGGGVEVTFTRKHRFTDFTTRKHYAGKQVIAIHVNGEEKARVVVTLA